MRSSRHRGVRGGCGRCGLRPDAWSAQRGFDGFLDQIGQQRDATLIRMTLVSDLVDDPAP